MSKIEVDKIDPQSGTALEVGSSGDTITVPSGATFTIASGATLTNSGTATGFAGIAWQSITTGTTLTTVAGKGYPIDTTSNACTVTLPGSASVGDQVQIVDYAGTFATNDITLTSSLKIEGGTDDKFLSTNREGVIITYVDVTQGWVATSAVNSGDQALDPNTYTVDFLVIAGGGGGGRNNGGGGYISAGGGGAGGYRNSFGSEASGGGGSSETSLTVNAGITYTVTIGTGGAGTTSGASQAAAGVDSSFTGSDITDISSAGGGGGGSVEGGHTGTGGDGGSGGGGGGNSVPSPGGSGTADQGYDGGTTGANNWTGSSGGGASGAGTWSSADVGAAGGLGLSSSITGSPVGRGGGGGSGAYSGPVGAGTSGGGSGGAASTIGVAGSANTGGGGGSAGGNGLANGGNGGSGVVILSMPDAKYSGNTTGSPTVATGVSGQTVLTFTGSGTYVG